MPSNIPSPSIMAQSQINLMDLFGKLYNIIDAYQFKNTQPAIWQCSDESQGIKKSLFGYIFDCPVFNLGQVGALADTNRILPASQHGQDIVIVGGSHIGTNVENGIGHIDRINGKKSPCCGTLYRILNRYLEQYQVAQNNINILNNDDTYTIEIPLQYLSCGEVEPELCINISEVVSGEPLTESNDRKTYPLSEAFIDENKSELRHLPTGISPIQSLLKKNHFVFNPPTSSLSDIELTLTQSLLPYMSGIVTCKYPHRRIADLNTWKEFQKITSHLTDTFLGKNRNIFLIAGLTVDYSIKKNMFVPQFGFFIDKNNTIEPTYFDPIEINNLLMDTSVYTPKKSFLEYAEIYTEYH